MPTSHPWNPNPDPSLIDADGNMLVACGCLEGPFDYGCSACDGTGAYKHPAPPHRPDKKIRCTLCVQGALVRWLAWDEIEIREVAKLIDDEWKYLTLLRGWDYAEINIVPKHVGYYQRNDADGKF